jgi:S-adenosylmethionine:tRNA ribosyltransferase-isomerase
MRLDDFDYTLPPELIAQVPATRRQDARLLVLRRQSGQIEHHGVSDLGALLPAQSLIVLNDTRVIPARLRARKPSGGAVEFLMLDAGRAAGEGVHSCLARSSKPLRPGARLDVLDRSGTASGVFAEIVDRRAEHATVRFHGVRGSLVDLLERCGEVPLPPYIVRSRDQSDAQGSQTVAAAGPTPTTPIDDQERYQTVYARAPGAVAAPTAGLHFTPDLLAALERAGHTLSYVTLHVGPGTFSPIRVDDIREHAMHAERYSIPTSTSAAVDTARAGGRSIVAVGTTVVRSLESAAASRAGEGPLVSPFAEAKTQLFIRPGYCFRVVDVLLTNFHLPRSTLLVLVAALVGRERLLAAYAEAVRARYRFYSYGDAMLVLP